MEQDDVRAGVYRHFKGGLYLVLGVARHDQTDELLVLYVRLYSKPGGPPMTARPVASFTELVDAAGGPVPRFRWVGVQEPSADPQE